MTREEALRVLGLGEGATEYEIERRFTVLVRRARTEAPDAARDTSLNEAFNLLTGRDPATRDSLIPEKMRKKVAGRTLYEWANLWHYGRWTLLGILVVVGILGGIVYSIVTAEKQDFQVAVVGEFALLDKDRHAETFPLYQFSRDAAGAVKPLLEFLPLKERDENEMDIAVRMQMSIILSGVNPVDLFITNDYAFHYYRHSGLFAPLEPLYERLRQQIDPALFAQIEPLYGTVEDGDGNPVEGPYLMGLDFTGTWLVEGLGINSERNIVCVGSVGKYTDKAERLILAMCEQAEMLAARGHTLHEQLQEEYNAEATVTPTAVAAR